MWKTHTFIGMTSGKEAFILPVHWLYIAGTSAQWVYICTARGTRGARAVTDGMSHWRLLRHPDPGSLQICRQPAASDSVWSDATLKDDSRNMTQSVMGFVTMMASDAILIDGWRTRKVPECGQLVANLECDSVNDSDCDEQIIDWFRSECLPGYLSLIRGRGAGELGLISGHHHKCYRHKMWSGELCHNPTLLGAVKHKMVNIRTCLFLFSS